MRLRGKITQRKEKFSWYLLDRADLCVWLIRYPQYQSSLIEIMTTLRKRPFNPLEFMVENDAVKKREGAETLYFFICIPTQIVCTLRAFVYTDHIHLGTVSTHQEFRGKGLCQRNVGTATKVFRKILRLGRFTLEVAKDNEAAQRCYQKVGFITTSASGSKYIKMTKIVT